MKIANSVEAILEALELYDIEYDDRSKRLGFFDSNRPLTRYDYNNIYLSALAIAEENGSDYFDKEFLFTVLNSHHRNRLILNWVKKKHDNEKGRDNSRTKE